MAHHATKPEGGFAETNEGILKREVGIVAASKTLGAWAPLGLHGLRRSLNGEAHHGRAAAGIGAKVERGMGRVERSQLNILGRETELLRRNLAQRRIGSLADFNRAFEESGLTLGIDLNPRL